MKKTKWQDFKKKSLRRLTQVFVIAALFHVGQIAAYKWINPPLTWTQFFSVLEGHTFHRENIQIDAVSPQLPLAVISSEDQLFAQHNGFDVDSIKKAITHNQKGKSVRGASTISQQVAKNVFLWQQRSWLRKGLEVYYTFVMELFYGKHRILELYLNVAEMGPGIFGGQAAATHYFKKSAKRLSQKEAALIAACLPNPKKFVPNNPTAHMKKKAKWIITQMNYLKTRPNTQKLLFGARLAKK